MIGGPPGADGLPGQNNRTRPMSGRKQRREYELWLKKTNPKEYAEWKAGSKARGAKAHQAHVENVRAEREVFYERKQKEMILSLREAGKTDEEIDSHIAKWIEGIKEF